jgi:hypothetical protein
LQQAYLPEDVFRPMRRPFSIGIGFGVVGIAGLLGGVIAENIGPAPVPVAGGYTPDGVLFIAIGPDGQVFRSDGPNDDRVVRVEPDGRTTVIAAGIQQLAGMAFDRQGDLFVSENLEAAGPAVPISGQIVEFHTDGTSQVVAKIDTPTSLAVDDQGVMYVVDGLTRVDRVTPDGTVQTIASDPQLDPVGLAVGPSGALYITDQAHDTVWIRKPDGEMRRIVPEGQVPAPKYLAVDLRGNVFVCQNSFAFLPTGIVGDQQFLQVPLLLIDPAGHVNRLALRAYPGAVDTQDVAVNGSGDLYLTDGSGVYVVRAPVPLGPVDSRAWLLLLLPLGMTLVVLGITIAAIVGLMGVVVRGAGPRAVRPAAGAPSNP